jgi:hypothetical protein
MERGGTAIHLDGPDRGGNASAIPLPEAKQSIDRR